MSSLEGIKLSNERAKELIQKYGSPLYVYDEKVLRTRLRELKNLIPIKNYTPVYSVKANSNIELLKIIREEGFMVDAMSPGEILIEEAAGFKHSQICMVTNNISEREMKFISERNILLSCDSLSQLDHYGRVSPGSRVMVRVNPGLGDGHSQNVITGGNCKFGIEYERVDKIKEMASRYDLKIVGINQHIGSLFLHYDVFIEAVKRILAFSENFENLEIIDFGGGYGVPYKSSEPRLDIKGLGEELFSLLREYTSKHPGNDVHFFSESGRYVVAECGELLGTVNGTKHVYGVKYVGTDLGFNVMIRPILYGAYHAVDVFNDATDYENVNIAGDICESGDIIARDRYLPVMHTGDIVGIRNAGAYGYSMASNYNSRLRPAEVLIEENGNDRLIRRRDSYEDLLRQL